MSVFFRNKRIATYIRTGLTRVEESKADWLCNDTGKFLACALGLAIVGKYGSFNAHGLYMKGLIKHQGNEINAISEILEINPLLASEINKLHQLDVPAEEIAECLEFETDDEQYDDFRSAR